MPELMLMLYSKLAPIIFLTLPMHGEADSDQGFPMHV